MAYVCWKTEDLQTVLSLEALSGKEELFLATHFPVDRFLVKKNSGDFHGQYGGQEELFRALVRDRQHMFCVIQGITGCGKSHLIRWLAVQWRKRGPQTDIVLLLPRSGRNPGRMVGVLRDQLANLGFDSLASQLIATDDLTADGRRQSFLTRLATLLDSRNVKQKKAQWEWCDQKRISDILLSADVREKWQAVGRLIADHEREELPIFHREEVWELVNLAMRGRDLKPVTIAALQKVKAEGDKQNDFQETDRLLEALNDRARPALRAALGLNERIISEVFTELRRLLHRRGRRLVILQEDITAAQGIDETLLDLFVSPAGLEGVEECPLVAVCGITPQYEQQYFNQTYGNRVTLHVDMSGPVAHGETSVSILGSEEQRSKFVARYLNAVRWSVAELREHWIEGDPPPSRCINCEHQDPCHTTFGAQDGYGLYPFTHSAIERGFSYLTDKDDPSLGKTPRNILLGLLLPSLSLKKQVQENRFPSLEVRSDRMLDAVMNIEQDVATQLMRALPDRYEQLQTLIGLWGDGGRTQLTQIDGQLAFAGVPQRVYEWFGLPWPGNVDVPILPPPQPPGPVPPGPVPPGPTPPGPTPPGPRAVSELDKHSVELNAWKKGEVIHSQTWWEDELWQIVGKLSWSDYGIPEWAGRQLLTKERVKLEGAKVGEYYVVLPFESWTKLGLQALLHLKFDPNPDISRYAFNYLVLVERTCGMAIDVVKARMNGWKDVQGKRWDPLRTAVECLSVYAWLNGRITSEDAFHDQWRQILSYPRNSTTAPQQRDKSWLELANGNVGPLQSIHRFVEDWLALRQGPRGNLVLEDAVAALSGLREFSESLQVSALPNENTFGKIDDLKFIAEAARFLKSRWNGLVDSEYERLAEQTQIIDERLEKQTVREAAAEINGCLIEAQKQFPTVAAHEVKQWAILYGELSREQWWTDGTFEEALEHWLGKTKQSPPAKLSRCITAPTNRLHQVTLLLNYGDQAIQELEDTVDVLLKKNDADPNEVLKKIRREGERVQRHAKEFKEHLKQS